MFEYYLNRVRPFEDQQLFDHPVLGGEKFVVRSGGEVTAREQRRAMAAYYAMVETCDRLYGQVLDAVRHAGQDLDDWIIVYTSDHGEMLGEHGVWEKQRFFEASARVPLIIRWPRRFAPGEVSANVHLCDLFTTFCDLTDVPTPEGLDSRSLVPLLENAEFHAQREASPHTPPPAYWDDESISQFHGNRIMIKQSALKYRYYGDEGPEVLFDLAKDPDETHNFADDPSYAQAMAGFRRRREELGFGKAHGWGRT